ncbi:DNA-binding beta-propeller fold protein YncE [Catenulispora sp. MAP12-49]
MIDTATDKVTFTITVGSAPRSHADILRESLDGAKTMG